MEEIELTKAVGINKEKGIYKVIKWDLDAYAVCLCISKISSQMKACQCLQAWAWWLAVGDHELDASGDR